MFNLRQVCSLVKNLNLVQATVCRSYVPAQHFRTSANALTVHASKLETELGETPGKDQQSKHIRSLTWARHFIKDTRQKQNGFLEHTQLKKIKQNLESQNILTPDHTAMLISNCGRNMAGDVEKNTELAKMLFDSASEKTAAMYRSLLLVYLSNNHSFSPEQFVSEMSKNMVSPDARTFAMIIEAYCRLGKLKEADHVFKYMTSKSMLIAHDIFGHLAYAESASGNTAKAMDMVKNAIEGVFGKNIWAWNIVTSLCCGLVKGKNVDLIEDVLQQYSQKIAIQMPSRHCVKLLTELSNANYFEQIPRVIDVCDNFTPMDIVLYASSSQPNALHDGTNLKLMLLKCNDNFKLKYSKQLCQRYVEAYIHHSPEVWWQEIDFLQARIPNSESFLKCTVLAVLLGNKQYDKAKELLSQLRANQVDIQQNSLEPSLRIACKSEQTYDESIKFLSNNGITFEQNTATDKNNILFKYLHSETENLGAIVEELCKEITPDSKQKTTSLIKKFLIQKCHQIQISPKSIDKMKDLLVKLKESGLEIELTPEESEKFRKDSQFFISLFKDPNKFKVPKSCLPRTVYMSTVYGETDRLLELLGKYKNINHNRLAFYCLHQLPSEEATKVFTTLDGTSESMSSTIINMIFWHYVAAGNMDVILEFLEKNSTVIDFNIDIIPKTVMASLNEEVEGVLIEKMGQVMPPEHAIWMVYFSYIHAGELQKAELLLSKHKGISCTNQQLKKYMYHANRNNRLKETSSIIANHSELAQFPMDASVRKLCCEEACRTNDFDWIESSTKDLSQDIHLKTHATVTLVRKCLELNRLPSPNSFLNPDLYNLVASVLAEDVDIETVLNHLKVLVYSDIHFPGSVLDHFLIRLNESDFEEVSARLDTIVPWFNTDLRSRVLLHQLQQMLKNGRHSDATQHIIHKLAPQTQDNGLVWKRAMEMITNSAVQCGKVDVLKNLQKHPQIKTKWDRLLVSMQIYHDLKYGEMDLSELTKKYPIYAHINRANDTELYERIVNAAMESPNMMVLFNFLTPALVSEAFFPIAKSAFPKIRSDLQMDILYKTCRSITTLESLKRFDQALTELNEICGNGTQLFKDTSFFHTLNFPLLMQDSSNEEILDFCLKKYFNGLPYLYRNNVTSKIHDLIYSLQFKIPEE